MVRIDNPEIAKIARELEERPELNKLMTVVLSYPEQERKQVIRLLMEKIKEIKEL